MVTEEGGCGGEGLWTGGWYDRCRSNRAPGGKLNSSAVLLVFFSTTRSGNVWVPQRLWFWSSRYTLSGWYGRVKRRWMVAMDWSLVPKRLAPKFCLSPKDTCILFWKWISALQKNESYFGGFNPADCEFMTLWTSSNLIKITSNFCCCILFIIPSLVSNMARKGWKKKNHNQPEPPFGFQTFMISYRWRKLVEIP